MKAWFDRLMTDWKRWQFWVKICSIAALVAVIWPWQVKVVAPMMASVPILPWLFIAGIDLLAMVVWKRQRGDYLKSLTMVAWIVSLAVTGVMTLLGSGSYPFITWAYTIGRVVAIFLIMEIKD